MTDAFTSSEIFRQLEELRVEGGLLRRDGETLQAEIAALSTVPESGPITITFDESGLLARVEFDEGAREGRTGADLVSEINLALSRAVGSDFSSVLSTLFAQAITGSAGAANDAIARLSAVTAGAPREFTNDFKTVTVSALHGSITKIGCVAHWIDSTPDHLVSDEIVRVAHIASFDTDDLGRFVGWGEEHG
ncbi:MAG: hypothetical protein ABI400_05600 [Lacisediminihabitans sp.]